MLTEGVVLINQNKKVILHNKAIKKLFNCKEDNLVETIMNVCSLEK